MNAFRRVLELKPCISIVHFRTEALVENLKREADETLSLPPLRPDVLVEIVMQRLKLASQIAQSEYPTSDEAHWAPLRKLAEHTGNPLTLLQWFHGLLRTQAWPAPASWTTEDDLLRLVRENDPLNGANDDFVVRVVTLVDLIDEGRCGRGVTADELEAQGFTGEQLNDALQFEILLPKHRFVSAQGYRLNPPLDLLRPSIRKKL